MNEFDVFEMEHHLREQAEIEYARAANKRFTCVCGNPQSEGGLSPVCKNCGMVMP